jgi:hypothetical protein
VAEYVILFRVPDTGVVDGILDDNREEFLICQDQRQADAYVEMCQRENSELVYQIVELDSVMSSPEIQAAFQARG